MVSASFKKLYKNMSMWSSVDEERPPKKLKLSPCGLSSLPDEVVLSCLARVSRWDHVSLRLVSKSYRSLMVSPDLYDFRSLMGCTENFNYLCVRIHPDPNPRWFVFSPRDHKHRRLVPIRSHFYQPPEDSSVVAHGHGIYVIGGSISRRRSSSVLFLDCRSHKWSTLPAMGLARASAAVGVVDGKIYVFGGCEDRNSNKWAEVFDLKTQTWDVLAMPPNVERAYYTMMMDSVVVEGKVCAAGIGGRGSLYIPSQGIWKKGKFDPEGNSRSWHVIDNVMYGCVAGGKVLWCEAEELELLESDNKAMKWREVMGLESLRDTLSASKLFNFSEWLSDLWEEATRERARLGLPTYQIEDLFPGHKLSNSGSNMLLFWDVLGPECLEIWCAEISLERRKKTGEIWGNIEWSDALMTLDPPPSPHHHCKILYSLSLNL